MNDSASYLLGSFASRDDEAATLYHGNEENHAEQLFGPGRPVPSTFLEFASTKRPIEDEEPVISKPAELIQSHQKGL
jgi:hypothetical protein